MIGCALRSPVSRRPESRTTQRVMGGAGGFCVLSSTPNSCFSTTMPSVVRRPGSTGRYCFPGSLRQGKQIAGGRVKVFSRLSTIRKINRFTLRSLASPVVRSVHPCPAALKAEQLSVRQAGRSLPVLSSTTRPCSSTTEPSALRRPVNRRFVFSEVSGEENKSPVARGRVLLSAFREQENKSTTLAITQWLDIRSIHPCPAARKLNSSARDRWGRVCFPGNLRRGK
jgi:hypothetical protein